MSDDVKAALLAFRLYIALWSVVILAVAGWRLIAGYDGSWLHD